MELIAAMLILYSRATLLGVRLAAGLMCGAIYFHLLKFDIVVLNDGG